MSDKGIVIRDGYLLFWDGWPSNWEPCQFTLMGTTYNCVEQFMMAAKARTFGDSAALEKIMASANPRDQKQYGRAIENYDDKQWCDIRYEVVVDGTVEKYRQNPSLREKLMATEDLIFVEASPYDTVWGIGMRSSDPYATIPSKWRGTNLLGLAITEARAFLRSESPGP